MNYKTSVMTKMKGTPRRVIGSLDSQIKVITIIAVQEHSMAVEVEVEDVEGAEVEVNRITASRPIRIICSSNHYIHNNMHQCNNNTTIKMLYRHSRCTLNRAINNIIKVVNPSTSNHTNPHNITMVPSLGIIMECRHLLHRNNTMQHSILNSTAAIQQTQLLVFLRMIQFIMTIRDLEKIVFACVI